MHLLNVLFFNAMSGAGHILVGLVFFFEYVAFKIYHTAYICLTCIVELCLQIFLGDTELCKAKSGPQLGILHIHVSIMLHDD